MNNGLKSAIVWVVGTAVAMGLLIANSFIEVELFEMIMGVTFIIMGILDRHTSDAKFLGLITIIVGVLNVIPGILEIITSSSAITHFIRIGAFALWYLTTIIMECIDIAHAFQEGEKKVGVFGIVFLVTLILSAVFYFGEFFIETLITPFIVFYILAVINNLIYNILYQIKISS